MFEVKLTVELPGIPEAINNLADALRGKSSATAKKAPKNENVAITNNGNGAAVGKLEGGLVINQSKTEKAPEPSFIQEIPPDEPEIPAVEQPEQAPPLVNVPETAPVAPAPAPVKKYTFKQISTAGAKLCADMGKMDALVSLLNSKYGVPAITMIDESRYAELAADLIGLGAVIEEE